MNNTTAAYKDYMYGGFFVLVGFYSVYTFEYVFKVYV